jgi:hypothetical protein
MVSHLPYIREFELCRPFRSAQMQGAPDKQTHNASALM